MPENLTDVVILDGALGTELEARGVTMEYDAWSAGANIAEPDVVRQVHVDYLRAGAEVLMSNTHSALGPALERDGLGDRFEDINRRGVELCFEARDEVGAGPIQVAGAISAAPIFLRSDLPSQPAARHAQIRDDYRRQAFALAEAGADIIALEMIMTREGAAASVEAALETGLPVWAGVSFHPPNEDGELMTFIHVGELEPERLVDVVAEIRGSDVAACMVMHSPLEAVVPGLEAISQQWDVPFGAYPHHGHWERPAWVTDGLDPVEFTAQAHEWVARGARWVGGCCGIGPRFIADLSRSIRNRA